MKSKLQEAFTSKNIKTYSRNLLYDIIGSIFFGIGIYNFVSSADFAPGGVTGLAIILNHYTDLPIGLGTFVINIPIIAVSFRSLGKNFLVRTFMTVLVNTFIIDLVCPLLPVYSGERLLAAIFAGALVGVGLAIIYHNGSSTGGSDLIIMSIRRKRPHMSLGQLTLTIDGMIIVFGGLAYGDIDSILYGFTYSAIMTMVMDKLMYGFVSGKIAIIVTDPEHTAAMNHTIANNLTRGATVLKAQGGYTAAEKDVIFCACSRSQLPRLHSLVREIDDDVMVIVTSYDEAYGRGFLPIDSSR
ncbi:MAG: YitT family protein [Clostridiaceae bacterium]|nr:YitT family protein [Clostridiaceae bacterium]